VGSFRRSILLGLVVVGVSFPPPLAAEPVAVRFKEGLVHGFLVLRSTSGELLANGDLVQSSRGDRVTTRVTFHFKDGSLQDETAVFSQASRFHLISHHLVQKGPSFPQPVDLSIDVATHSVVVRYQEKDGKEKTESERLELPPDLANGLIPILLKNLGDGASRATLSFVAATPKPLLVKLEIASSGEQSFTIGSRERKAIDYVVHVDIGGIKGAVAGILGKQPEDSHVWVLAGEAPAFVRSDSPLFPGGPTCRIELASPVWPR
jgi:hypothetical protein